MKSYLWSVFFLMFIGVSFGQQETNYTQYAYNLSSINPGALAMHNQFKVFLSNRFQWTGVKGAPSTQYLSVESPVDYENLSVGVNIVNDIIGPLTETELVGNIAHQIPLFDRFRKLSFGVRIGGRFFNADWSKGIYQYEDPLFLENTKAVLMTFGLGAYYQGKKLFGGVSVNNILPNKATSQNDSGVVPNYSIMAGYRFKVEKDVFLKPVLYTRITDGAPLNLEASLTMDFRKKYNAGISYRHNNAIAVFAGINMSKDLRFGYSYDIFTSKVGDLGFGSHELLLIYTFTSEKYQRERRH